ncbi:olfactory receptor 1500-like [Archocentrus centrarchus]|uniref:olfactory receptor 1500-like n=1 Tax=Archocentrus centrarchus TaxID=63155 RepID=UPI0011E9E72D|nr:olfactory receptor 1500-like [Archocentrus centrarchus]
MSLQNASIKVTHFIIGGFDSVRRPVAVGVVMLVTYLLAVLANMVNIVFIISDKRLHKPMYLLICNLAVVDIVYTSSSSPTMIGVLIAGVNTISYVECLIQMFVFQLGMVMELFALAIMALDRLIAIMFPFQYHTYLTNTRTVVLACMLWVGTCVYVAVLSANLVRLPHCSSRLRYAFCDYAAVIRTTCIDPNSSFNEGAIILSFFFFFTFIFICLSYFVIGFFIKFSSLKDKTKMGSTCVSHLIIVTCYYCPLFVLIALTRVGVVLTLEERQGLLIWTVLGPSLVNPFVYSLRTKEIKNKIFKVFKKG